MEAKISPVGKAAQTPENPKMRGKIIKAGIKNINCRLRLKKIDQAALPTDWKNVVVTIWKPTTGKLIKIVRRQVVDRRIKVSSLVNSDTMPRGNNSPIRKPAVVTAVATRSVSL